MFKIGTYREAGEGHSFTFLDCTDWVSKPGDSLRAKGYPEQKFLSPGMDGSLFTREGINCC